MLLEDVLLVVAGGKVLLDFDFFSNIRLTLRPGRIGLQVGSQFGFLSSGRSVQISSTRVQDAVARRRGRKLPTCTA